MLLLDFTNILLPITPPSACTSNNCHIFNPSITNLRHKNLYLVMYRVIKYEVPGMCLTANVHPWAIWMKDDIHRPPNQWRPELGTAFNISFREVVPESEYGYDTTGCALFKWSAERKEFQKVFNIPRVFYHLYGDEMNQDTRVDCISPNECIVTYNVFPSPTQVEMRWRHLTVSHSKKQLIFGKEYRMFEHIYRSVEKNCIFLPFGPNPRPVLYGVGYTFDILDATGKKIHYPCPIIQELLDYYDGNTVLFSSSTPAIPATTQGRWLACGHIKFIYQKISKDPFASFVKQLDFSKLKRHGQFIYTAFFYEFDEQFTIHRVSQPFLPTSAGELTHEPYLLAMPTGLTRVGERICLSYGEGDARCKAVLFEEDELDRLLAPRFDKNVYFLGTRHHIQHFGYFSGMNVGDDAFVRVFDYLHRTHYPQNTIEFTTNPKNHGDLIVMGGGDVVADYFVDSLNGLDVPVVAVGVGVPYIDKISLLRRFKRVILRNQADAGRTGHLWDPDMTFLLPRILAPVARKRPNSIGISVLQTYYNSKYPNVYAEYTQAMSELCTRLVQELGLNVYLIPFCLNPNNNKEGDLVACWVIANKCASRNVTVITPDEDHVASVYQAVSEMEFMVCARFHSHIFSTIHGIPFVSITCGRKCIEYMKETGLDGSMFQLQRNREMLPVGINSADLFTFIHERYMNRKSIARDVQQVSQQYQAFMVDFEREYLEVMASVLKEGKAVYL